MTSAQPSPNPRVEQRKRLREESPCSPTDENQAFIEFPHYKRFRGRNDCDENAGPPSHLVVHQVNCNQEGQGQQSENHHRHAATMQYFDRPQLYRGDNKASPLRGMHPMVSMDAYLDENPGVSFVVYRQYDCVSYHDELKNEFKRLHLPLLDPQAAAQLRPYFFVLYEDASPAPVEVEHIKLTSQLLEEAMASMAEKRPLEVTGWDSETNLQAPYLHIYHLRPYIRELMAGWPDQSEIEHVSELLNYFEAAFGAEYQAAEDLFAKGRVSRVHFHKLFGPNKVIVSNDGPQPVAYVSERTPAPKICPIQLKCHTWTFDGLFKREEKTITVDWTAEMPDEIDIESLPVYPLEYDQSGLEERLRKRGEIFWQCRKRKYVSYKAPKLTFEIQVTNPRYMVDISMYHQLHSSDDQHPRDQRDDLRPGEIDDDAPPGGYFILLLPPDILGFGFHDKKWRRLLVEHIQDVLWNKAAFERLVLDEPKKELIKALVQVHIDKNSSTDVIEGKGNGLIILLHGGPGTGKTLTAESVAEEAEKPLYRVTCGDIGTEPEAVEKYLDSVLYIGSIWKAVVLLDESDVFLEERTQTDLQRNALVSVFLRVLEYYEGILILTSNRVGMFDEAFKSRIQLAMHYPPLDEEGRWKIWDGFIQQLADENAQLQGQDEHHGANVGEIERKRNVLARHRLNGRQIRNALKTARQLANFKKEALSYAHLDRTIKVVNEFEEYVEKTHGHTDSEYAMHSGHRLE